MAGGLVLTLALAGPVHAQIFGTGVMPVTEIGGQLIQSTITAANSVTTAINVAAQYVRQGEQLINEYNMIRNQINQYETMVRNLARLPQGLNFLDTFNAYSAKLTGLLGQTNAISYDLNRATSEFQRLYNDADTLSTGDLRPLRERFLQQRMAASATAVQVQAVQANIGELFQKLCTLLGYEASGNLDQAQLAAQHQALQTTTLQQIQALQATAARLEAQRQAEEVALARMKQRVQDKFVEPLPEYTGEAGQLPTWSWVTPATH